MGTNQTNTMAKKDFSKLTPEEVQALTGKDLEAYNAWILEQEEGAPAEEEEEEEEAPKAPKGKAPKKVTVSVTEEEAKEFAAWKASKSPAGAGPYKKKGTAKEIAADYFERHPETLLKGVVVMSDGEIFPLTDKGKNHAENYRLNRLAAGVTLTSEEVSK